MSCAPVAPLGAKILGLTPCHLLSNISRERCIANINNLPAINIKGGRSQLHWATVLVPLCVDYYRVCLLYSLKAKDLGPNTCQVTFPGGLVKMQNVCDVALRNTERELGIPSNDIQIWTTMGQVVSRAADLVTTPVIGEILAFDRDKLKLNKEVAEIFTIPMKVFCDSNNHGFYKFDNVLMPVFSGGKHRLWGLTAMITHQFLYSFLPNGRYKPSFHQKEFQLYELKRPQE